MPPIETFKDAASYYATLSHEATHNAAIRIMPHLFENPRPAG
ncbi:hypothetical protein CES86_5633 [Brucella lupini]|uniref:Uncharacterized protein n=1 Tax=Brucella lupini TaxID=255457 RepID=A0A256H0G3_9HYPH|nr:hypothetical protein CES86_5633 [Brucella lupini]CAD7030399.1 hypothetical protein RP007_03860 [Rhizobium sp. P007]